MMTYVTGLAASLGLQKATSVSPEPGAESKPTLWLDPVCTLIALTVLKYLPVDTKLSFDRECRPDRNRIEYDQGLLQGITRTFYGSGSEELYVLTLPLFYAAKWLNPAIEGHEQARFIFETAQSSLECLRETYKKNPLIQQYLTTAPLRIIKHALDTNPAKPELKQEDFYLPDNPGDPLMTRSSDFWKRDTSLLNAIHANLKHIEAKRSLKSDADVSSALASISADLRDVYAYIQPAPSTDLTAKEMPRELAGRAAASKAATLLPQQVGTPPTALCATRPVTHSNVPVHVSVDTQVDQVDSLEGAILIDKRDGQDVGSAVVPSVNSLQLPQQVTPTVDEIAAAKSVSPRLTLSASTPQSTDETATKTTSVAAVTTVATGSKARKKQQHA